MAQAHTDCKPPETRAGSGEAAAPLGALARASGFLGSGGPPPALDDALVDLALREGLGPLLAARLAAGRVAVASPRGEERLRRQRFSAAALEMQSRESLEALLVAFREAEIPALLLKGEALRRMIYRDPECRLATDLDLLVPASRWREAVAAVLALGGEAQWPEGRWLTKVLFHELGLSLPQGGLLDLHRALVPWPLFRVDTEGLFQRAHRDRDGALLPAPADLFLHLALHVCQDGFAFPFRTAIDALGLVATLPVSPEVVVKRARSWRAAKAVAVWLRVLLACGLQGAEWAEAAEALDPGPRAGRLAEGALHRALRGTPPSAAARRSRLVRAQDSRLRGAGILLFRSVLLLGDLALRPLPGFVGAPRSWTKI